MALPASQFLHPRLDDLVAGSGPMQECVRQARALALSDGPVLVLGESGAGCGTLARAIHRAGARVGMPLMEVGPAAIPAVQLEAELLGPGGVLEQAAGGTLLVRYSLPEPEDLLRRLVEGLARASPSGGPGPRLIQTLFPYDSLPDWLDRYFGDRRVTVPPLRERREDILPLAERSLEVARYEQGRPGLAFSAEARQELERRRWSGNVRDLHYTVVRAAVLSRNDLLSADDLK